MQQRVPCSTDTWECGLPNDCSWYACSSVYHRLARDFQQVSELHGQKLQRRGREAVGGREGWGAEVACEQYFQNICCAIFCINICVFTWANKSRTLSNESLLSIAFATKIKKIWSYVRDFQADFFITFRKYSQNIYCSWLTLLLSACNKGKSL